MSLETEIKIQNRIFAEFMGAKIMLNSAQFKNPPHAQIKAKVFHFEQLKYHSSWEWLMPVVEKIESSCFRNESGTLDYPVVKIFDGECLVLKHNRMPQEVITGMKLTGKEAKFAATYAACTEFVKWYNEQRT